jgi:hypothetical protein
MSKHDAESQFYRNNAPVLLPQHCPHNHPTYHDRFGYVNCKGCHTPMGWHPDLVRPGLYGLSNCEWHGNLICDCNTGEYRTMVLDRLMGTDDGMRMLAIGQRYFDALEGEAWSTTDYPHLAEIDAPFRPTNVNFIDLNPTSPKEDN